MERILTGPSFRVYRKSVELFHFCFSFGLEVLEGLHTESSNLGSIMYIRDGGSISWAMEEASRRPLDDPIGSLFVSFPTAIQLRPWRRRLRILRHGLLQSFRVRSRSLPEAKPSTEPRSMKVTTVVFMPASDPERCQGTRVLVHACEM